MTADFARKAVKDALYAADCDFTNNDSEVTHDIQIEFAKTCIRDLCSVIGAAYAFTPTSVIDWI